MADLLPALTLTLKHEGIDTNDPDDSGKLTRFGISQSAHPDIDVASLTLEQASQIWRKQYWNPLHCDFIKDQELANKIFDTSGPCGILSVAKAIQQAAINISGHIIDVDGVIGPMSVELINHCDPVALLAEFRKLMDKHYDDVVIKYPIKKKYIRGWKIRLYSA